MATVEQQLAKEKMFSILHSLPDDSSYDDLLKELAMARMIDRGLADLKAGRTISHEEVGKRIESWRS